MYIWPVACCIDPQWKERCGPEWKKQLKEIVKESSATLEEAANCHLALLDAISWPIPRFEEAELQNNWLAQKKELGDFYFRRYNRKFDEDDLKGIFLLNLARMNLIRFSHTIPYKDMPGPPILHLGFVGSLYWFHLASKPLLTGGGIASINIPFVAVNFIRSKKRNMHMIIHEILHLFGARHDESGI